MSHTPTLSIVTATLGEFIEKWLEKLLSIEGDAEFIMSYPPGVEPRKVDDPRVRIVHSLFKGETPQRMTGFFNVTGRYLIALDDDDILHPNIVSLTNQYFEKFPESWVMRPYVRLIPQENELEFYAAWAPIPDINSLGIAKKRTAEDNLSTLQEVPIIPLEKPINFGVVLIPYFKRRDQRGPHMENFNNRVWRSSLVLETLLDIAKMMRFAEPFTWLPAWGIDRLMSVYLQAKFYQRDQVIGHWLPEPEQVRYLVKPQNLRNKRYCIQSEALVFKKFPQYGYLWNFFFDEFYNSLKTKIRDIFGLQMKVVSRSTPKPDNPISNKLTNS